MAELILEPYAVTQHWKMPPGADLDWPALLGEYLQAIARACTPGEIARRSLSEVDGPCVVGHIKALALFPGSEYLQVSVVSPTAPTTISGKAPEGLSELDLTLNVIVYGLECRLIQDITAQIAAELASQWKGEISAKAVDAGAASPTDLHQQ